MARPPATFLARWNSLSDSQQKFLLSAYEIDSTLPHSSGMEKVLPAIPWRTAGVMCGIKPKESDEIVQALADQQLVLILDAEKHQMSLISYHDVRELLQAQRRRWLNWILIAAAALAAVVGAVFST